MGIESALDIGSLVRVLGEVKGRKRLQKIVHLLGENGHKQFQRNFILHHFGPFSRSVASDLDFLRDVELITEEPPDIGEACYRYRVKDDNAGSLIDELCPAADAGNWRESALHLNAETMPALEALSTLVFLARTELTGEDLRSRFRSVKPQLGCRFDRALKSARALGFLRDTKADYA